MKNHFKNFDDEKAIDFFAVIFDRQIKEILKNRNYSSSISNYLTSTGKNNWIQNITIWFWNWTQYMTKINDNVMHFWPFIEWLDNELLRLSRSFKNIDTCLIWNKFLYNQEENNDNSTSKIFINAINSRLYVLESENIILTFSRLFDDNKLKDKSLKNRFNLRTFLRDTAEKDDINVKNYLTYLNSYIETFDKYVHKEYSNLFNSYKHNFTGDDQYNEKNKWQDIYNIYYILEKFFLPMLKLLFRWKRSSGSEYILEREIQHTNVINDAYKYLWDSDHKSDRQIFTVGDKK